MIIAIDFDGTIVEHEYPEIGPDVPGAISWMRKLRDAGASLILWTMRDGPRLDEAVEYCTGHGIDLWGINRNPTQDSWSRSPKQYAHLYIDDAAVGCPLVYRERRRPFVDWSVVGPAALAAVTGRG